MGANLAAVGCVKGRNYSCYGFRRIENIRLSIALSKLTQLLTTAELKSRQLRRHVVYSQRIEHSMIVYNGLKLRQGTFGVLSLQA
ncbi:MAG: hypothetical protein ACKESB_03760 [Candidatus Hodgkinia cicadicola]